MTARILVASHDAGGATSLAPVVARLRARATVEVWAHPLSAPALAPVDRTVESLQPEQARQAVRGFAPDLLLTGSSWGDETVDKRMQAAAREAGVASLGILDSWTHYRERFTARTAALSVAPGVALTPSEEVVRRDPPAHRWLVSTNHFVSGDLAEARASFSFRRRSASADCCSAISSGAGASTVLAWTRACCTTSTNSTINAPIVQINTARNGNSETPAVSLRTALRLMRRVPAIPFRPDARGPCCRCD